MSRSTADCHPPRAVHRAAHRAAHVAQSARQSASPRRIVIHPEQFTEQLTERPTLLKADDSPRLHGGLSSTASNSQSSPSLKADDSPRLRGGLSSTASSSQSNSQNSPRRSKRTTVRVSAADCHPPGACNFSNRLPDDSAQYRSEYPLLPAILSVPTTGSPPYYRIAVNSVISRKKLFSSVTWSPF
jgi:hypothetical protein